MLHFIFKEGANAPSMFESFAEAINGTADNHNLSFYTRMDYKLRVCKNLDEATFDRFPLVLAQYNVADENMIPSAEGVRPIELDVVERHIGQYDSIVYGTLAHDGINSEDWFFSESQLYGVNLDGTIVELSTGDAKTAAGNQLVVLYTFVKMGAMPIVAVFMNDGLVAAGSSCDLTTSQFNVRTVTAADGTIVDALVGWPGIRSHINTTYIDSPMTYSFGSDMSCIISDYKIALPIKRIVTYGGNHKFEDNKLIVEPDPGATNVIARVEFDFGPVFESFEGNLKPLYTLHTVYVQTCYFSDASKPN